MPTEMHRTARLAALLLLLSSFSGAAFSEQFKSVQFVWTVWTGSEYRHSQVLESVMPVAFEVVDPQNSATGLYYGTPNEVEELERAGNYKIPRLTRGVFQRTTVSAIAGSSEAKGHPFYDSRTGTFRFETELSDLLKRFPNADIQVIALRRADTRHFPILISEIRMGSHTSRVVHVALPDSENSIVARLEYFAPEKPTVESVEIWNQFVANLHES